MGLGKSRRSLEGRKLEVAPVVMLVVRGRKGSVRQSLCKNELYPPFSLSVPLSPLTLPQCIPAQGLEPRNRAGITDFLYSVVFVFLSVGGTLRGVSGDIWVLQGYEYFV